MPFPDPPNPVFPASFSGGTPDERYALVPPYSDSPLVLGTTLPTTDGGTGAVGASGKASDAAHQHPAGAKAIEYVFDGGGAAVVANVTGDVYLPVGFTVTGWVLLADQAATAVVNVWSDTLANYPPTVADKITAAAPPSLAAADHANSNTLTGWTTALAAGATIRFNVDSNDVAQRLSIVLIVVPV